MISSIREPRPKGTKGGVSGTLVANSARYIWGLRVGNVAGAPEFPGLNAGFRPLQPRPI
jgi:hypothetical protein